MGRHPIATAPEGTPHWIHARVHRLAREGHGKAAIATRLGLKTEYVDRLLRRPSPFERCPTCGGMVVPPCSVCAQLAAAT